MKCHAKLKLHLPSLARQLIGEWQMHNLILPMVNDFAILCMQVDTPNGELPYVDTSHIYHGHVLGEPNSHVFGSIHDGVFEGKILTDNQAYYVEHAKHYFPNRTHLDYGFHSVIYNERDVIDDPFAHKRKHGHANGCGISDDVAQWMESVQNAGVDDDDSNEIPAPKPATNNFFEDDKTPSFKYTKEANFEYDDDKKRTKRAARAKEDNRNTCSLYIQTDPLIWRHIREGIADVSCNACYTH